MSAGHSIEKFPHPLPGRQRFIECSVNIHYIFAVISAGFHFEQTFRKYPLTIFDKNKTLLNFHKIFLGQKTQYKFSFKVLIINN